MQLADIPAKFAIPFAANAGAGYIRTVPQTPSGTPGQASLDQGFPPENFQPVSAGGVPPFGQDFNGLLKQTTSWARWQAAGVAFPPYDPTFQTAVGGYPQGAIVQSLVETGLFYLCLVDNNVTNPDAGGAGWFIWSRIITQNTDLYVNAATGSDSNNGLTPATALATIQAAILKAWTFPPSQYNITIHVAAGSYAGAQTPLYSGPSLIIDGGTASSVTVDGGGDGSPTGGVAIAVYGPNTLTVQNITVQNSTSSGGNAAFLAQNGASLTTKNTISNSVGGAVFQAKGSASVAPGNHTFKGNCYALFWCNFGGSFQLPVSTTYTIANAITVALASAFATGNGSIGVPSTSAPTFVNAANVTGAKYAATFNGVIAVSGNGINYFPGSVAGSTSTGGQYG